MSKTINDAKQEHCRGCKETSTRFYARLLGFTFPVTQWSALLSSTKEKFSHQENTCSGCYWFDPKKFIQSHSALMEKKGQLRVGDMDLELKLNTL